MNYFEKLKECENQPVELSKLHLTLAYEYAKTSTDYEEYLPKLADKKKQLMEEHKTMSKAEAMYDLSAEGIWEKSIRIRLKGYEKLLSGIKQRVQSMEAEARNQF